MRRLVSALAAAVLLLSLAINAPAKTLQSAKGENIFFYASDDGGKAVLLKVIPLGELKKLAHGQLSGDNYYISSTDNYPATQYCEARGITIPEFVEYVKSVTSAENAGKITFSGGDTIRLMATDSYGGYNRSWTYDELYSVPRYYFEGLFDPATGWNTGWETAGEDSSKFGVTLEEYNALYKDTDPYYSDKRAVFEGGVPTAPILATESFSGRTTSAALVASTEIGIAEKIAANGGKAAGSLRDALEDTWSLRLSLPMTEADLMAAHRTAFDNFKWIYNLRLDMEDASAVTTRGSVAAPAATVKPGAGASGSDSLTIEISCETPGSSIYYSFDGAPQIPYEGPVSVDTKGRDLAANPIAFYMTAVREGYDDAGIIAVKYPGLAPAFRTLYSAMAGERLTFEAHPDVTADDWERWSDAVTFVTLKTPSSGGYARIDGDKMAADADSGTVTFDGSLFPVTGSYSFVFHAEGYADKSVSVTMKKPAPEITVRPAALGAPVVFLFDDSDYLGGLSLYVTPPGGDGTAIASGYFDRSRGGGAILKASYFDGASCAVTAPGEYKFSLVNSRYEPGTVDVTVEIGDAGIPELDDVAPDDWYYDAVRYALAADLIEPSGAQFGAGQPMKRADLAVALYRLSGAETGEQTVSGAAAGFSDVSGGAGADAVAWAAQAGIIKGFGDGTFRPDANITREQLAAMLYRCAMITGGGRAAVDSSRYGEYSDADDVADWAEDAMRWAVGAGVINGADGKLVPRGAATRAQTAGMMLNYNLAV
ncbi:MAG: S-layer homology domain-containing protein [Oscillospiraceae bacterium]|jgi:hypothetical protein|nr:S-layer homology domain-containing protein [Oscillospiraceae bacterium]